MIFDFLLAFETIKELKDRIESCSVCRFFCELVACDHITAHMLVRLDDLSWNPVSGSD